MSAAPEFELYADQKSFNETIAPGWQSVFEAAIETSDKARQALVFLEVGSGDVECHRHLLREGLAARNIYDLEVCHKRVALCHELGWDAVSYFDGTHLPFADDSVGLINVREVIEHVPELAIAPLLEDAPLLEEMRRVLRPRGFLMISALNCPITRFYDFSDIVLHHRWVRLRDDPIHVSFCLRDKLAALLGGFFADLEQRSFKDGSLYERMPKPRLRHKLYFLCGSAR